MHGELAAHPQRVTLSSAITRRMPELLRCYRYDEAGGRTGWWTTQVSISAEAAATAPTA
ncbi:hypothetical protein KCP78_25765 [Salmonella enterica subsp. enterica]|nr:hypothetical protein KCP78_25765 [Salmonella enterica subsp. enterica]